jgi:hypothetical protein
MKRTIYVSDEELAKAMEAAPGNAVTITVWPRPFENQRLKLRKCVEFTAFDQAVRVQDADAGAPTDFGQDEAS